MRIIPLAWAISLAISCGLFLLLGNHVRERSSSYLAETSQLTSQADVDAYLAEHWIKDGNANNKNTIYIPTGVFIESLGFANASSVNVSGYIWQKYAGKAREGVARGFVLPDATELWKEEAYVRHENGTDIVGWYFEAKITHNFDYSRFPFDHKRIWLRLWHQEFDSNVVLVPDLESYDTTRPYDSFGLDESIVLSGYTVEETFFRYLLSSYDTNFGLKGYVGQKQFPELYFNVELRRNLLDALVIHLLPLIVIFLLAFITLISITTNKKREEIFEIRFSNTLQICSGLLFIVLLAHIRLRETFTGVDTVYLENMHLTTYLALIYVSLNAYALRQQSYTGGKSIIAFQDNLIPKVLFFPFFLTLMLVVTYINFSH